MMPSLAPKPSISTSNWFNVCSLSSWPPPSPAPRWRPTASISSIKIIQGAFFFACEKRSRTRDAPTPTNISTKSEPLILKKGTPASPATALASNVFPVPGGPKRRTPLGILAPIVLYLPGLRKNSTISDNSSFASSAPATSLKDTFTFPSPCILAWLLPKFMTRLPPPCVCCIKKKNTATRMRIGTIDANAFIHQEGCSGGLATTLTSASLSAGINAASVGA